MLKSTSSLGLLMLPVLLVSMSGCNTGINVNVGNTKAIKGSGKLVTEDRQVEGFTKVHFRGAGSLLISQGDNLSLKVTVDDNLQEVIQAEVDNGTLTIKPIQSISTAALKVELVIPQLNSVELAGAVSADLRDVDFKTLSVGLSGATRVNGKGKVVDLIVNSSGASIVKLRELKAETVDLKLSGAGKADVYASRKLNVSVSGAGMVTGFGGATDVEKTVSGAGRVKLVQ